VALISALSPDGAAFLSYNGVDLAPAIEQMLFLTIRSMALGRADVPSRMPRGPLARLAVARALALAGRPTRPVRDRIVVITLNRAHAEILRPIRSSLAEAGGPELIEVWDGSLRTRGISAPPLDAYLPLRSLREVGRAYRRASPLLRSAAERWSGLVDETTARVATVVLRAELRRSMLDVATLQAVLSQGPSLVATFDEIGRRGRLVGATARHSGVPSLDLPHAEAADPDAIRGADYDAFGVFGPRARHVLELAGIPPGRIHEIGPSRFDALARRAPSDPVIPHRFVFASQWLGGRMTSAVKRETLRIAVQAMAHAAPCELVVVPHPLERDSIADDVLSAGIPAGVAATVDRSRPLYEWLEGAWALLTGWSNATFEGLLAGAPVLCINATGAELPTTFVEDGMALGASSVTEAEAAIQRLENPEEHARILATGRAGLSDHIGPLDGHAADRAAALITAMALRRGPGAGPAS
jgi:hypothetical protein